MDSEDERDLEGGIAELVAKATPILPLRLYEDEERRRRHIMLFQIPESSRNDPGMDITTSDIIFVPTISLQCYLDLTGRHQRRYQSLFPRWIKFVQSLRQVFTEEGIQVFNRYLKVPPDVYNGSLTGEDGQPLIEYVNPKLWVEFNNVWRLTYSCSLDMVLRHTCEVLSFLEINPEPKFQKQLLDQLPPELIHVIMGQADIQDVRRLSAVSRTFHQISLSYVYKHITVSWSIHLEQSDEEITTVVHRALQDAQQTHRRHIEFFLSRPDILRTIDDIHFDTNWDWGRFYEVGIDNERKFQASFSPIMSQINTLLRGATAVTHVKMSRLFLSESLVSALQSLPKLLSIEIISCRLPPLKDLPQVDSVQNVYLCITDRTQLRQWRLIPAFINLRNLVVHGSNFTALMPPARFRIAHNPFNTLERLVVSNCQRDDIFVMSSWILAISSSNHPHLTHLEIVAGPLGITVTDIQLLLRALSGSPMQVLILYGIRYAQLDLLEAIAATFPDLIGLTLSYRHGIPRVSGEPDTLWPRPLWEYAERLALFHSLKFFQWNQTVNFVEYSTGSLPYFESNFSVDSSGDTTSLEDDQFMDWDVDVKTMAAYCPTLKYVAYLSRGPGTSVEYDISRTPEGHILISLVSQKKSVQRSVYHVLVGHLSSFSDSSVVS
ncbi:hypothetical protein C8Q75DRAFT_806526 [Abortiporus biennis]|nr:hypothetical protein C8Q75DRAFT_806526 [Abortiporus biennis]